jgi:hypothetical protein
LLCARRGNRHQHACSTIFAELHRRGEVPALGGSFSPVLDRMFQRALAKRLEDRGDPALELAATTRTSSRTKRPRHQQPTTTDHTGPASSAITYQAGMADAFSAVSGVRCPVRGVRQAGGIRSVRVMLEVRPGS